MKNITIILVLLFGIQFSNAQEFKTTLDYIIDTKIVDKQDEYQPRKVYLRATDNISETIAAFAIEGDAFEGIAITVLEAPELDEVTSVIKVDIEYLACCASVESYYFLETTNKGYVALPKLENVYCDASGTTIAYAFPSQGFGAEETIKKVQVSYTEAYEIKAIDTLNQIVWLDDNF